LRLLRTEGTIKSSFAEWGLPAGLISQENGFIGLRVAADSQLLLVASEKPQR